MAEDILGAPRTGTISRDIVGIEEPGKELVELPIALGDTEASTLAQRAELNFVTEALGEGQHVTDIERRLIDDKGMEPYDARSVLLDGLSPAMKTALETTDEANLKLALVQELGYPEELVNDMFSTPDEAIGRYRPPILNDVTETNEVQGEDLEQLTSYARNVHALQVPLAQGLFSTLTEDKAGMQKFRRTSMDLNYSIANTLRKMGKNVEVSEKGDLVEITEAGPKAIDESFLWDLASAENEIGLGATASIAAYKLANTLTQSPGFGKFGWIAKSTIKVGATALGGGAGASAGRALDVLHNSLRVKEEVDAQFIITRMKDAGIFAATTEVIGAPLFAAGAKFVNGIGKSYDMFVGGNKQGAYTALKDLMHLTDSQVDDIIMEWEKATGVKAEGSQAKKALSIIPQTEPGGEAIIRSAAGLNPKSSSAIARSISDRAKDLLFNTGRMTNDNVGTVMNDELNKYVTSVKDYYTGVKDLASDAMSEMNYRFDYDKLAIDPLMENIHSSLTNPAVRTRFELYMNRVRDLGNVTPDAATPNQLRSFDDLLELRKTVNEFKSRTRIVNKKDFEAVNSVLNKVDAEIKKVAKTNPAMGESWNKAWKQANTEYSKMFDLKQNVLFKALTRKGVNTKVVVNALTKHITAIDGTFMQVLGKLPPRARAQAEGAVIDALTKNHTIGFESGLQATHFTNLAEELKHVGFTTPHARELKRAINQMAKVFKNDVELSRATGQVARPHFQSYLTTDPVVRLKYEIASTSFNYVKRLLPGGKGEAIALVTNVASLMENPANSKAMAKVLTELPMDAELQSKIRQLAIEYARFGYKETYPKVQLYRTGVPGSTFKSKDGPLGKGIYWTTSKSTARSRSRVTGGKVIKEKVLPSRIATEQNIKDALGVTEFKMQLHKDDKTLQNLLKDRGYDGLSIGEEVLIFK